VADVQDISVDEAHKALVTHGTVDKMMACEWLVHQLDIPAASAPTAAKGEYRMAGENGEVVKVFRVKPSASNADLTAVVTAIRTIADLQRLFPFSGQNAIVARGSRDKMDAAEWLIQQLLPPVGTAPTGNSAPYSMAPLKDGWPDEVTRILRLDGSATNPALTEVVTAIRTIADVQRLFPFQTGKALIMRATPDKVAVAEWLVKDLNQQSHAAVVHQTTMPGETDNVVRLFYLNEAGADVASLVTQLRDTAEIKRVFPLTKAVPAAVVVRGRPDQMSLVETMISKFGTDAGGNAPHIQ
jgi:hypothetical protein